MAQSRLGIGLEHPGQWNTAEKPSIGRGHIIIPRAAAALIGGPGTSLPLSAFYHAQSLGHRGVPLFSIGGRRAMGPLGLLDSHLNSPLLHFGAPLMSGLGALRDLQQKAGKEGECKEEEEEGKEGKVLNLSAGVWQRQSGPLFWEVVPRRALLLKTTVVS